MFSVQLVATYHYLNYIFFYAAYCANQIISDNPALTLKQNNLIAVHQSDGLFL